MTFIKVIDHLVSKFDRVMWPPPLFFTKRRTASGSVECSQCCRFSQSSVVIMQCVVCMLVCVIGVVSGVNILVVIPTIFKSHYVGFEALVKGLAQRGHNITVITAFPRDRPVDNVHEISVKSLRNEKVSSVTFNYLPVIPDNLFNHIPGIIEEIESTRVVMNATVVSRLLSSDTKFDLIICEMFLDDMFLGIANKLEVPVVGMSTCLMHPWIADRFGIPNNPAYVPMTSSGYSTNMDLYQRMCNSLINIAMKLLYWGYFEPKMTEVVRQNFSSDVPPVSQLVKNISLYFINNHFSMFGAQPYPPQVVDVSGLHLKPVKSLSQELDKWMNESTEGVIYFSFGSMLRGATLPTDKVKSFLEVFETLPQRVLWKWEDDTIDRLPKNVKIMKWLPQRDILAHPNVKVFISHGGLLGTTEAVVSGVPILGIPMYGDQPNNVAALVENRVAIHVDYNNISVASLSYALNTLINDKSYSQNAKELSRRFLDRPMSSLDTAVYWTEYVIRHKGAPHLQSAAVHLPWYQYYLLDVIGVLIALLIVLLTIVYYTVKYCLRLVLPKNTTKLKRN